MTQQQDQADSKNEASPGGIRDGGAASRDMGEIGKESVGGSPAGESGDGAPTGPAANGSFGSGTYNERGDVTGPDSPAGSDVNLDSGGEAQGDDIANRLGGEEGRGTGATGAGAATGDISADRSESADAAAQAAGGFSPDAGSPGGMGGSRVGAGGSAGSGRPPGGVSPMENDGGNRE